MRRLRLSFVTTFVLDTAPLRFPFCAALTAAAPLPPCRMSKYASTLEDTTLPSAPCALGFHEPPASSPSEPSASPSSSPESLSESLRSIGSSQLDVAEVSAITSGPSAPRSRLRSGRRRCLPASFLAENSKNSSTSSRSPFTWSSTAAPPTKLSTPYFGSFGSAPGAWYTQSPPSSPFGALR